MRFKPLTLAAAVAIAFAPFSVIAAGSAHAAPPCPGPMLGVPWTPQMENIRQQCLQAGRNQDYCGDARGCTPGDPCVVGSAVERAVCNDARLSGQQPHF